MNIPGTSASLDEVQGILVDKAGNVLFSNVADGVVLRLDAATGVLRAEAEIDLGGVYWVYSVAFGSDSSRRYDYCGIRCARTV